MPRFAADLSTKCREHAFLDRFGAVANDGFKGIEFLFSHAHAAAHLRARLTEPDLGEVNNPYLPRLMDEIGYAGRVGSECRPKDATGAGFGWLRPWP